jgi:hypothetical protein
MNGQVQGWVMITQGPLPLCMIITSWKATTGLAEAIAPPGVVAHN